jgi:hypothetical protein
MGISWLDRTAGPVEPNHKALRSAIVHIVVVFNRNTANFLNGMR